MSTPIVIFLRDGKYHSKPGRLYMPPKLPLSRKRKSLKETKISWATNEVHLEEIAARRRHRNN